MISEMKAMAEENRRMKRMCAEMSMENDLLKEALEKCAKVVSKERDGRRGCLQARRQHRSGVPDIWRKRNVLSV